MAFHLLTSLCIDKNLKARPASNTLLLVLQKLLQSFLMLCRQLNSTEDQTKTSRVIILSMQFSFLITQNTTQILNCKQPYFK